MPSFAFDLELLFSVLKALRGHRPFLAAVLNFGTDIWIFHFGMLLSKNGGRSPLRFKIQK
jgi:hypothetical protein